jgi:hypothetical protein
MADYLLTENVEDEQDRFKPLSLPILSSNSEKNFSVEPSQSGPDPVFEKNK